MRIQFTLLIFSISLSFSLFAQQAPDFKVKTTDGEDISLYANYLEKGKSVVIELFFVDCPPCRSFAPHMADLHSQMVERDIQVEFISLSIVDWDTDETVNGFKSEFKHDWPFVNFEGGSEAASEPYRDGTFGQFFGTPTIAVIAPDGTVNYVKRIFNNEGYIEAVETAIIESQTSFNENNEPATAIVSGGVSTANGEGLEGVIVNFSGAKDTSLITNEIGAFQTGSLLIDGTYKVSLEKDDNHTNGVTTLDIIFISKHILGIDTFTTSQEFIAGDVNKSGSVTTFDLVLIRQLILGVIPKFPNNTSWVFEPAEIELTSLADLGALSFTGIKIGDLNGSANPNNLVAATDRDRVGELTLSVEDREVVAGEMVNVVFSAPDFSSIQGFQFTVNFDSNVLIMNDLGSFNLPNYTKNNFNLLHKENGLISTSWNATNEQESGNLFSLNFKAQQAGKLSDLIELNSRLTSAVAYDWNAEALAINLIFTNDSTAENSKLSLYPNPSSKHTVFLEIGAEKAKSVTITCVDINGKIINSTNHAFRKGSWVIPINTANFAKGIYTVQVSDGEKMHQAIRFVKQ